MIEVNEEEVRRFHGEKGTPSREAFDIYLETLEGIRRGEYVDGVRPLHIVLLHALTTGHMSYGDSRRLMAGWFDNDPTSYALFKKIRSELKIKEAGDGL